MLTLDDGKILSIFPANPPVWRHDQNISNVCAHRLKRGIRTVGAKNMKKYPKDAELWIMEGRFSVRPDREHGNPLKPSIYLKMNPLFYVCVTLIWKGASAPWGLKIWKKYPKNAHSPIIDDRFSHQPDREHGNPATRSNPFEPAVTQTKTWPMRSSPNFGEFPPPISFDSFDFFSESAVTRHDQYHRHRILCSLA